MATAEELRKQLAELEVEEVNLKKMSKEEYNLERRKGFVKSKLYDGTKMAIIIVILFLVMIGTLGSMHFGIFTSFSMSDFVKFLESFSPIFITLTGSIGLGGTAKNIAKSIIDGKKIAVEGAIASGEQITKGGI